VFVEKYAAADPRMKFLANIQNSLGYSIQRIVPSTHTADVEAHCLSTAKKARSIPRRSSRIVYVSTAPPKAYRSFRDNGDWQKTKAQRRTPALRIPAAIGLIA
jgi:hypothetical protein